MPVRRRTQSRMLALQALCVFEAVGERFERELGAFLCDNEVLHDLGLDPPVASDVREFAGELARGAWTRRSDLDARIQRQATRWSVARMTPVDRNILRLGLYELIQERATAPEVVLNEAVELAKTFGSAESPAFVNGVLDAIRRELSTPPAPQDAEPTPDGNLDGSV